MNKNNVSYCGLYCAECGKFKNGKCPGCDKNEKATWCKIRTCCKDNNIASCAECKTFTNQKECARFNNFIGKTIEFFTGTSRFQNLQMIHTLGYDGFATHMSSIGKMSLKKKK